MRLTVTVATAVITAFAAYSAPVAAQEAAANSGLDEVTVTARKRVENLQDVPISITTFGAESIERLGLSNIDDLASLDSSLIYDKGYSATDTRIAIRGLSPSRGRVNVAVLVDGIDTSSESINFGGNSLLATNRLMDLQSAEIVKGPQAAKFGRSAFAGAISYTTKDPSKELSGSVGGEFGDFGRYEGKASLSGPLGETFGWRLNLATWNDGAHKNRVTGAKVGGGDGNGAALTLKWTPSENFDVKTRFEWSDDHYDPFPQASLRGNTRLFRPAEGSTLQLSTGAAASLPGACTAITPMAVPSTAACRVYAPTAGFFPGGNGILAFRGTIPGADSLNVQLDPDPRTGKDYLGTDRTIKRFSMVAHWDFGKGVLSSLTGYTDAKFNWLEDGDFDSGRVDPNGNLTSVDIVGRATQFDYDNSTNQFSQELRFQSKLEGRFNFMVGGLYWKEDVDQLARSVSIVCSPATPANTFFPGQPAIPPACQQIGATSPLNGNQVLALMTAIPRPNGRLVKHESVFGELSFKLTDRANLTVEARRSNESEQINGVNCSATIGAAACQDPTFPGFALFGPSINYLYPFFNPFATTVPGPGVRQGPGVPITLPKTSSTFTTPRASIDFRPSDGVMVYVSYAEGHKPKGISTTTSGSWNDADYDGFYDEVTFKAEEMKQVEFGAKMQFFNNRLRVNPSFFHMSYKDKQTGAQFLTPSGILVGRIVNAGKATVKGLDLEAEYRATQNLTLGLNYTWLDSVYDDFPFTTTSSTDAARFGTCVRGENPRFCYINLAGRKIERAPEHSLVATARWQRGIGDLLGGSNVRFFIEGDMQAQGERYVDIWNRVKLDDFVHANLRVGLQSDRWDVMVYANNVTDDDTVMAAVNNPGAVDQYYFDFTSFSPSDAFVATMPDPRFIGLRFSWRFGAGN
jgi:outer membrane receptor protein involved in Fe transport